MIHLIIALKIIIILVVSFLITFAAVKSAGYMGVDIKDFKQRTGTKFLLVAGFFNLLFIGAVALLLWIMDHKTIGILGWHVDPDDLLFSIAAFILTLVTAYAFLLVYKNLDIVSFDLPVKKNDRPASSMNLLGYIVLFIAALQEEVLFRGYLSTLLTRYGFLTALLISTLIFTLWHFMTNRTNIYQVLDWFIGGALLYYIYVESNSIWVASIVHFSRNFTNVIMFDIAGNSPLLRFTKKIRPPFKSLYTLFISTFIFLTFLYIYHSI